MIQETIKRSAGDLTQRLISNTALGKMWYDLSEANPGATNPYHNNAHMFSVASIAGMLFEASENFKLMSEAERQFNLLILITAGMWHDYAHSAGLEDDHTNIQTALLGFRLWITANWSSVSPMFRQHVLIPCSTMYLLNDVITRVSNVIRVTEFPFVREPKDILQSCIRDADLLYTFAENTGPIVHGLYLELKQAGKFPDSLTFSHFMDKQAEFLNSCYHYTEVGKFLHQTNSVDVLRRQMEWAHDQGFM